MDEQWWSRSRRAPAGIARVYVEGAQRGDRPPGPFRTYNFYVDKVLASAPAWEDAGFRPCYTRLARFTDKNTGRA